MLVEKVETGLRLAMPTMAWAADMKDNFDFVFPEHALDQITVANIAAHGIDLLNATRCARVRFAAPSRAPGKQHSRRHRAVA